MSKFQVSGFVSTGFIGSREALSVENRLEHRREHEIETGVVQYRVSLG